MFWFNEGRLHSHEKLALTQTTSLALSGSNALYVHWPPSERPQEKKNKTKKNTTQHPSTSCCCYQSWRVVIHTTTRGCLSRKCNHRFNTWTNNRSDGQRSQSSGMIVLRVWISGSYQLWKTVYFSLLVLAEFHVKVFYLIIFDTRKHDYD